MSRVEVERGQGVTVISGDGKRLPVYYKEGKYYIREAEARNMIYGFNPKVIKGVEEEGVILVDESVTESGRQVVRYVEAESYVKKLEKQMMRRGRKKGRNKERKELRKLIMKELYNVEVEDEEREELKSKIEGYEIRENKSEIGTLVTIEVGEDKYLSEEDIADMMFGDRYSEDKFSELCRAYRIENDARVEEEGKEYRIYRVGTIMKLLSNIMLRSQKKSLKNISNYLYKWIYNEFGEKKEIPMKDD